MVSKFLDFEQPIAELQARIEELRYLDDDSEVNIHDEIERLKKKSYLLTKNIFSKLTPWQVAQMARHPMRPYTLDYVKRIFTDFVELHGDRYYSNAPEIVGGIARLDEMPVMILGHQKGRSTNEKLKRNFGMAKPESYRKALRLMKLAEKFQLPIITFIDTAGAYPGIEAEEHNQSEAIARNLYEMAYLKTPIITTVIGEGGSGGALAIGVSDRLLMLQYSYYSVITPEGCASILWKDVNKAPNAAKVLSLTADKLKKLKIIDEIIQEPLGGAHRNISAHMSNVKSALTRTLKELSSYATDDLVTKRNTRIQNIGII